MQRGHVWTVTGPFHQLKFMTSPRECDTHVGTKPAHLMFIDNKAYIGCYYFKAVWKA